MVEQDVRKGGFAFSRVKGSEVNASIGKGLVGRCEDRERSRALERLEQFGLNDSAHQRIVNTGALSRSGNIVGGVGGHQHRVDDVDDTVAGVDVGDGHGGVVDHHAVADGEREGLSVDRFCRHALGKGRGGNVARHNVVEQNVGQGLLAFEGVEGSEVDAGVGKGLVGRGEERERSGALERLQQFGLDHGAHQRVVNTGALGRAWNVVGGVGGHQHLVDDVNDAVAGVDVRQAHVGVVDHHTITDGEGERVAVDGGGTHAVRDVGGGNSAGHDVVEQDVREGFLAFGGVERSKVNPGVGEGLVGRGKDRERTGALQRFEEFGLNHTGHQRIVDAGALGGAWNVVGRVGGHEHFVDDVDQAVGGDDVGHGHVGIVDHHAVADGERELLTVGGVGAHAVGHVRGGDFSADDVVEENVRECFLALGGVKGAQVNACVGEGLVGRGEDREGSGSLEGGEQVGLDDGGHERAVDAGRLGRGGDVNGWDEHLVDDVNDAVGGLDVSQRDGGAANQHVAAAGDAELDLVTVGGGGHHAVLDVAGANFARHDVVEQNGGQRLVFLGRVEVSEIDASVGKGLVGWSKDGERAGLLERGHQVGVG